MKSGRSVGVKTTVTLCVAVALGTAAEAAPAADNPLEESLRNCARYADDSLRLACVDKLIAADTSGTASEPKLAIDEHEANAAQSTSATLAGQLSGGEGISDLDNSGSRADVSLTYNVINIYQDKGKRWYFQMENGDVWRQTEARYLPAIKQFPIRVRIAKGVFGSHDLRADQFSGSIKVKRHK